jgi:hypothetical protein
MGASIEPYPIGPPRILNPRFLSLACVAMVGWFLFAVLDPELAAGQQLPNWAPPAIDVFPDHNEFVAGKRPVQELVDMGRKLFQTPFSILDGAGRLDSTVDSKPTIRVTGDLPLFQRIAGPDANSCGGYHNQPIVGGAGDFAANVFVGVHFTDPPAKTIDPSVTNDRNRLSNFGAIERVAREMTSELQNQRDAARVRAASTRTEERNGSFRVDLLLVASCRYPQPGQGHPHVRRRASRRRACVDGLIISNHGRAEESLYPTIESLPEVIEGAACC